MDPASLAAGFTAAQTAQLQLAVAAKLMKMDAQNAADVVKLISGAQDNVNTFASLASGIGGNLDVSA